MNLLLTVSESNISISPVFDQYKDDVWLVCCVSIVWHLTTAYATKTNRIADRSLLMISCNVIFLFNIATVAVPASEDGIENHVTLYE